MFVNQPSATTTGYSMHLSVDTLDLASRLTTKGLVNTLNLKLAALLTARGSAASW